jgi:predicted Fe-S protein YdhL (DUF1289 family)
LRGKKAFTSEEKEAVTRKRKEEFRKKIAEINRARWAKMTPEEREAVARKKSEASKARWEEMTPEERETVMDRLWEMRNVRLERAVPEKLRPVLNQATEDIGKGADPDMVLQKLIFGGISEKEAVRVVKGAVSRAVHALENENGRQT